jgi:transcription-repair coupling factor (superfamily II helicase)
MTPDFLTRLSGPLRVGEAAFGADVRALVDALQVRGGVAVYIAHDERQARSALQIAQFCRPTLATTLIPAWDCPPYDRTSPSPETAATRCFGLSRLATWSPGDPPLLVATTGASLTQRVPPRDVWQRSSLHLQLGGRISGDRLTAYLQVNGYARSVTVRERGEFAIRGGIIDLFPPTLDEPVRLDLFGDTLDGLRAFDPETQRTTRELKTVSLAPVSEIFLDEASLAVFRTNFLDRFGAPMGDPLYDAVRSGLRRQGVEHWLALFHTELTTLPALAPPGTLFAVSHLGEQAARERFAQALDYHGARRHAAGDRESASHILNPSELYLPPEEIRDVLAARPTAFFAPGEGEFSATLSTTPARDFAPERLLPDTNIFEAALAHAEALRADKRAVIIAAWSAGSTARLASVLSDHCGRDIPVVHSLDAALSAGLSVAELPVETGFTSPGLAVIAEQDILGDRLAAPRRKRKQASYIAEMSALSPGDLVVHVDHGVGRYEGLKTLDVSGAPHDCLDLSYAGGDKLYLPVENIELVSRFGGEGAETELDRLGSASWQSRKARAKKRIMDMAEALIATAAERQLRRADSFASGQALYEEFAARFPYEETDDQLNAIDDVLKDLSSGRPMDRLICGDVGFGKTEVALRAAFVAAMSGHQVAVIAPTTLLARQHFNTFTERFRGWPIQVRALSRLVSAREATETRAAIAAGTCEIVVGTHALLAKGIAFARLGLLIVDEEQRFGVTHKERLKSLKADVHVLTLSATPIPRTLQLALTGIRDLSIIATPPVDRLSVRTYLTEFDTVTLREALLREKYRGGQAYFVAPRVADLPRLETFLKDHVPEVSFTTAHGQMGATELEDIMSAFYEGRYDVLLSTTIVESGLDIPRANTLIIHRADMFGLAQLYQLRGRVGRSKLRAYAYLTTPRDMAIGEVAERRLKVLQSLDSLGAGFTLASHDLDMRGGGNLLGDEQSGHVREVGVELYQSMLEEAVKSLRSGGALHTGGGMREEWSPAISLGAAVLIPETYVTDLNLRLSLYRRLGDIRTQTDREGFAAELIDRFGPMPEETRQLLEVTAVKGQCKTLGIARVDAGPKGATLSFRDDTPLDAGALMRFVGSHAGRLRLRPDGKLVFSGDWSGPDQRIAALNVLLQQLARLVPEALAA